LTAGHVIGRHTLNNRSGNMVAVEFLQTDAAINSGNSGVMGIISNIIFTSE